VPNHLHQAEPKSADNNKVCLRVKGMHDRVRGGLMQETEKGRGRAVTDARDGRLVLKA
jgi:hypothetical protein